MGVQGGEGRAGMGWGEGEQTDLEPRRDAILGRRRSGRSIVLATPITAKRLLFLIGHSNRLYST